MVNLRFDISKAKQDNLENILNLLLKLSEKELREVSLAVHERIKLFSRQKSLKALKKFNLGERVKFKHNGQKYVEKVIRINQKTVSVQVDDSDIYWTVSPNYLRKAKGLDFGK